MGRAVPAPGRRAPEAARLSPLNGEAPGWAEQGLSPRRQWGSADPRGQGWALVLSKGVPWAGFLPGIWATLRAVASAVRGPQPPACPLQPAWQVGSRKVGFTP